MNKDAYRAIASPWDEEDVIAAALQDYQAEELRPNREWVQKMARGFLHRFFVHTLWGKHSSCTTSAWSCMTHSRSWTI